MYQRRTTKEIAIALGIAPGTAAGYCKEAVALLGASDRREAAELLHAAEAIGTGAPSEEGGASVGVFSNLASLTPSVPPGKPAHILGPLAPANRDADNDASITARLAWILGLAIGLAIGFGSIVAAARALSDVVRVGH